MAHRIRRVEYFHVTVPDRPGEAFRFLSALAEAGLDLLAFTAIPVGIFQTQLTIFPSDPARLQTPSWSRAGTRPAPWWACTSACTTPA
jgi:hypothetical protein